MTVFVEEEVFVSLEVKNKEKKIHAECVAPGASKGLC